MSASLFRLVHRVTGLAAALFVVVFVATGIPLQFTDALKLGTIGVPFRWVHAAYGIQVPVRALASNEVVQVGEIALSGHRSFHTNGVLRGARQLESVMVIATSSDLMLVSADARAPVETTRFPYTVNQFGIANRNEIVVDTANGVFVSNDYGASWRESQPTSVRWLSVVGNPTTGDQAQRYGAAHVAWERWLQDLHSGRFFGPIGVWVMTVAGVALLILSVTGLFVWWSSRRNGKPPASEG